MAVQALSPLLLPCVMVPDPSDPCPTDDEVIP
jgi:hypothetical protein